MAAGTDKAARVAATKAAQAAREKDLWTGGAMSADADWQFMFRRWGVGTGCHVEFRGGNLIAKGDGMDYVRQRSRKSL